jgi:hypothetical protein
MNERGIPPLTTVPGPGGAALVGGLVMAVEGFALNRLAP